MMLATVAAGCPVAPFSAVRSHKRVRSLSSASIRRTVRCNAEEPGSSSQPAAAEQQQRPAGPPAPEAAKDKFDLRNSEDALGPLGNFLMATLLIFLCGASMFFTVGRSFQPDMVPLEAEYAAMMMAEAKPGQ